MLKRVKPAPPPPPIVILADEPDHDAEGALARRIGGAAFKNTGPAEGADGTPFERRALGLTPPPAAKVPDSPIERRRSERLRALLAGVELEIRQRFDEALAAYRVADRALTEAREVAGDFSAFGITGPAALANLRQANEGHAAARAQLGQASEALHAALLEGAERLRLEAAAEERQRLELKRAAELEHRAAVEKAQQTAGLVVFIRDRPRRAVEQALSREAE